MCAAPERHPTFRASFAERANHVPHPLSNYLLRLMELKKSNLCLSADVTSARELIALADQIGPSIVILKTHYDLVAGWDYHPQTGTGAKLGAIARKHGFLIFEDRKFGDIGSTVQSQYTAGTARIIDWAHIVNVNMIPGKAAVTALLEAAARWRSRVNYEVRTSVSVGTPVSDSFDENGEEGEDQPAPSSKEPPPSTSYRGTDHSGRKGSIVSITTLTQSFEPVDSPRFATAIAEGDELVYAGIEEPPWERGLLILAQMSSAGNFMNKEYTQACVEAAREHKGFVMGFVSQEALNTEPTDTFISMTPGCQLPPEGDEENGAVAGDDLGQQYNTPARLVGDCGSDIIIVGRGILKAASPQAEAERYRRKAWKAYLKRIGQQTECDRKMPCTNCVSRNKAAACRYEAGAPPAKPGGKGFPPNGSDHAPDTVETVPIKTADFGYTPNSTSTLGILRKIEGDGEPLEGMPSDNFDGDHYGIRERYKALVRQLPARTYVEKLADIYLRDINWQYFSIDEPIFRELMDRWYNTPFNVLSNSGPQALDPMLRAFPALLFQMLASALLYLPEGVGETFESLKYTGNMTFDDLAFDYSESGISISSILGKRQMSIITVLAGWVRACFLKYTGMVTEAWHQIGTCIRDAQEIGLHRDQMDPQPGPDDSTEDALEKMWMAQSRRRIWMILLGWDLHTGAVLGRPTSVDYRLMSRSLPVDSIIPKDRKRSPIVPRGEDDPPTPLTRAMWSWECLKSLRDILNLEKEGPFPKDFSKVENIHRDLLNLRARIPAPFRLETPDTRFDNLPGCWWLPYTRPILPQLVSFNIMALHRPYVFTRAISRREALQASLDMLEAQKLYFAMLKPHQHRTFTLFFGTFDATIMIASIYILFPKEHLELLPKVKQHFEWAIERFEMMAVRNRLAQAALGVLHAINIRFKKSVGCNYQAMSGASEACSTCTSGSGTAGSSSDIQTPNSVSEHSSSSSQSLGLLNAGTSSTLATIPERGASVSSGAGLTPASGSDNNVFANADWSLPTDFDFSTIMPIYPMGDVAYNDLVAVPGDGTSMTWSPETFTGTAAVPMGNGLPANHALTGAAGEEQTLWQFGGEFGNDTLWNILNQFPTY
ncbi:Orotidine 5'-phosphate decarboxylase [Durotheca rogersii]|uniref:Orotidine 5'-phosphate decarboxylase n=1 Tax=Durotheca rogersii TaxID=419775 RepID=UPI0022200875|nr:Orotidine 5'-phosphate decarboxylase [Durotheca rogersii]KAI5854532.1 Orotidine 5'-phosphate decarboxylase [Durotheca rogersii]